MEKDNINISPNNSPDLYFDDYQAKPKMSFDFVLWFYRILKYWYLFVIFLALCLGYAYIKNKSWVPLYRTTALLVLEARGNIGVVPNTYVKGTLVSNSTNQQMILTSYDMTVRTVKRLPQLQVSYFRPTKFNVDNLYGKTPITIECLFIKKDAYGVVYTISPVDNNKCKISIVDKEGKETFAIEVPYGEFVQESMFYIKVNKTDYFKPAFTPFNFRFVTENELVGRYSGSVRVSLLREGSSILVISKVGTNTAEDAEYLKALLAEYEDYNLLLKNEAADRSIVFLEKQLELIKDSLNISESALQEFQNETGLYNVKVPTDIRALEDDIVKRKTEYRAKKEALSYATQDIEEALVNNTTLPDPTTQDFNNGTVSAGVAKYNELLKSFQNMMPGNPLYKVRESELDEAQLKILKELENVHIALDKEKGEIDKMDREWEQKSSTLPVQEREYIRIEKKYQTDGKYNEYLSLKIRDANLQKATSVPDNYVLEEPRKAGGAINGEEKKQTYMFSLFIGLLVPLLFVICKEELFNFTIATKEECERITGLPVIGTVENVSKKITKGRAIVKNFPKSSFAESFRNMRIRIEYMAQKESGIAILVTSAEPADGKTFVAANIASIYQLTGKKTILVDFDLRRPSVSKLLDIHSRRGVSNYLIGQVSLDEIVITHPDYGFDVIPAGTLPPNPSELIKTKKTKDLLEYLHTKYDYVIVDCSPVGLVSDAYILAKLVNTTLFVVRRAKTNKSFIKSVTGQIRNDGINNVGVVFNDVKGREGYYGTSRYYGDKAYMKRNSYYHDDYFEK